jgi:hypothetical protein
MTNRWEEKMEYRCYFFGASGQLVGADTIAQDCDSAALAAARKLFAQRAHATGYELRQGSRSVAAQELARKPAPQSGRPRAA